MACNGVKRVAVIGAGLSGVSVLRRLSKDKGYQLTCFEKNYTIGGAWFYTDKTVESDFGLPITSAMYSNLRTNIPKQLMEVEGFPLDEELPPFPGQPEMLQYINRIADACDVRKYIKLNTEVQEVKAEHPGTQDTKWKITYCDVRKKKELQTEMFDIIIVCSGNCTTPNMPNIEGEKQFEGYLIHSMTFRHPEMFKGQTVALLGAHFSGMDIAVHLSKHAKKVYLCHKMPKFDTILPSNIIQKASGLQRIKRSSVVLENGEELNVDSIIYCTGFRYHYPFLPPGIVDTSCQKMVTNLYKDIVPVDYRSLLFMAIPREFALFCFCDHLALFILGILNGTIRLPDKEQMKNEIRKDIERRPVGGDTQWEWDRELSAKAENFTPLPAVLKKIWDHHFTVWGVDFVKCRTLKYRITGPDSFVLV